MERAYYAIIPATVRYDKDICPNAKLLYGEITALCSDKGFCWATNTYFANLYSVSIKSISTWVSQLIEQGHLVCNYRYREGTKAIQDRCLSIPSSFHTYGRKLPGGMEENFHPPMKENFHHNNTSLNTTNENIIIPPTPLQGDAPKKPDKALLKEKLKLMIGEAQLSSEVKRAVFNWLEYKKYAYVEKGFSALLAIVSDNALEYGDSAVCTVISESMGNMYKGIVWDKLKRRAGYSQNAPPVRESQSDMVNRVVERLKNAKT